MIAPCHHRILTLTLWGTLAVLPMPSSAHAPVIESASRLFTGHTNEILALAYSPDGQMIASSGSDLTIRLWQPSTGRELTILRGHVGSVRALSFSPDGRLLASGSADR